MSGESMVEGDANPRDGRDETEDQRADRNWNELLQELRVIQTGTQIISGFLLTVAFQQRFSALDATDLSIYGVLVGLAAMSTILGLAIVALHRTRFRHHDKPAIVTVANRMLRVLIVAVAILSIGVVLLIFDVVFGRVSGIVAGGIALVVAIVLLGVIPRRWRARVKAS
jgi:MFS family permease